MRIQLDQNNPIMPDYFQPFEAGIEIDQSNQPAGAVSVSNSNRGGTTDLLNGSAPSLEACVDYSLPLTDKGFLGTRLKGTSASENKIQLKSNTGSSTLTAKPMHSEANKVPRREAARKTTLKRAFGSENFSDPDTHLDNRPRKRARFMSSVKPYTSPGPLSSQRFCPSVSSCGPGSASTTAKLPLVGDAFISRIPRYKSGPKSKTSPAHHGKPREQRRLIDCSSSSLPNKGDAKMLVSLYVQLSRYIPDGLTSCTRSNT